MSPVIRSPHPSAVSTLRATDFSEYPIDVPPDDWTPRWVTTAGGWFIRADANSLSGKILRPEFTVDGRRALTWNPLNGKADFHMLSLVRSDTRQGIDTPPAYTRLIGRLLGTDVQATQQSYHLEMKSNQFTLFEYTDGVGVSTGAVVATPGLITGALPRYWVRLSAVEGSLSIKSWRYGGVEPSTGASAVTDTTPRAAGDIGVGGFTASTNGAFEYFAVGDTPPPVPT